MSTEPSTLSDFSDETGEETAREFDGAMYGRTRDADAFEPKQTSHICKHCESDVAPFVARVVGDNDDCVPVCSKCAVRDDRSTSDEFDSTTRAVKSYRRGRATTEGVDDVE